jgi:hypothetical protein
VKLVGRGLEAASIEMVEGKNDFLGSFFADGRLIFLAEEIFCFFNNNFVVNFLR